MIRDYASAVQGGDIRLAPCAWLHDCADGSAITDPVYAEHIALAPTFIRREPQALADFLKRHVRYGDRSRILCRIDNGRLRPSKSLADELASLMTRNREFELIDDHGFSARWNLDKDGGLWIMRPDSVHEVGCIHTCQGLELEQVGVIVGPDFVVRDGRAVTDVSKRSSRDRSVHGYEGWLKRDPQAAREAADRVIRNTYRTLMTRGMRGCYLYCTDDETNEYFRTLCGTSERAELLMAAEAKPDSR